MKSNRLSATHSRAIRRENASTIHASCLNSLCHEIFARACTVPSMLHSVLWRMSAFAPCKSCSALFSALWAQRREAEYTGCKRVGPLAIWQAKNREAVLPNVRSKSKSLPATPLKRGKFSNQMSSPARHRQYTAHRSKPPQAGTHAMFALHAYAHRPKRGLLGL